MQIEKYPTENEQDGLKYFFSSLGKDVIEKVVEYQLFPPYRLVELGLNPQIEVYNLAFGDRVNKSKDFIDKITSNNGDMDKVLATVANTAFSFWAFNPDALIWFEGSNPEKQEGLRTYLYQKKIERFFEEISQEVYVLGKCNNQLEVFTFGKKYEGFLINRKS